MYDEENIVESSITFGYFDYSNIWNQRDGLRWYENAGVNVWAFTMKQAAYG